MYSNRESCKEVSKFWIICLLKELLMRNIHKRFQILTCSRNLYLCQTCSWRRAHYLAWLIRSDKRFQSLEFFSYYRNHILFYNFFKKHFHRKVQESIRQKGLCTTFYFLKIKIREKCKCIVYMLSFFWHKKVEQPSKLNNFIIKTLMNLL